MFHPSYLWSNPLQWICITFGGDFLKVSMKRKGLLFAITFMQHCGNKALVAKVLQTRVANGAGTALFW